MARLLSEEQIELYIRHKANVNMAYMVIHERVQAHNRRMRAIEPQHVRCTYCSGVLPSDPLQEGGLPGFEPVHFHCTRLRRHG